MASAPRLGSRQSRIEPEVCAQLGVSAEDRYALLEMKAQAELFAHPFVLGNLGYALSRLGHRWDPIWDFRGSDGVPYNDALDAYAEAAAATGSTGGGVIVAEPREVEAIRDATARARADGSQYMYPEAHPSPPILAMRARGLQATLLDLAPFDEDLGFDELIDYAAITDPAEEEATYGYNARALGIVSEEGLEDSVKALAMEVDFDTDYARVYEHVAAERSVILDAFLTRIASNSLLVELGIHVERDRVTVVPYHSHSLHHVAESHDGLVLVRPAREHAGYVAAFGRDIARLERLLNDPSVKERQIEEALLGNPLFLRGLNYQKVYAQVVLPRNGGNDLRPDIIAEPIDAEWAEIIDLKLPSEPVLVGRPNRARLAAGITSVVRQLQEYASYFDERAVAARVESRYGFRCYRPRLVAIVGRDPTEYSPEETKRAMTSFPDVEIVTYDKLLRAARRFPLF